MNFLSHYYLHNDKDDNYFTVGLTLPDILSIHSRKMRVSEKFFRSLDYSQYHSNIKSLAAGMICHYHIDRWFHTTDFFRNHLGLLQEEYRKYYGKLLSEFHTHILLEIFVDRFLLVHYPGIADEFYKSYRQMDFTELVDFFNPVKGFDAANFLKFTKGFSYSTFLKEYVDFSKIPGFLERISSRVKYYTDTRLDGAEAVDYLTSSYHKLEPDIDRLFANARELPLKKEEILAGL